MPPAQAATKTNRDKVDQMFQSLSMHPTFASILMQPKFFGDPLFSQTEQEAPFINFVRIQSKYNENEYVNTVQLMQDIA